MSIAPETGAAILTPFESAAHVVRTAGSPSCLDALLLIVLLLLLPQVLGEQEQEQVYE